MSEWHDIGSVTDAEREGRLVGRVGGREVGVVYNPTGEKLHGIRNRCPHHGGQLCLGTIRERLTGAPGSYELSDRTVLRCPWHGWEFDLESGRCLEEPTLRAAVYPVRVEGERVLVQV